MSSGFLQEVLLIESPSSIKLYNEMAITSGYFVAPFFIIALCLEFFGEMDFKEVIKKLFIIVLFIAFFKPIHTAVVDEALIVADNTLKTVSPDNFFMKRWNQVKVKHHDKKGESLIDSFIVPNLNDLLATALYLLSKVALWLLKLVYSAVYHFTYVFSGITALLYFFVPTNKAIIGTVQSTFWCAILPMVVVAILALVGNSFEDEGVTQTATSDISSVVWLFGVTLLLLIAPIIVFKLIKGEAVSGTGGQIGGLTVAAATMAASHSTRIIQQAFSNNKKLKKRRK